MIKSQELADMLLEAYSEHCQISNIELFKNFIKRETIAQVFSCEFCEISKNTFFLMLLVFSVPFNGHSSEKW